MPNYMNKIGGEPQERSSNIELLRILSMFLVLTIHYIPYRTLPTHDTFPQPPFSNIVLGDRMPYYRIRRNRFLQHDRPIQDIISQHILPLVYRSVHRTIHTGPDDKPLHRKIDTSGVGYIHSCFLSVQHLVRLLGKSL